MRTTVLLAASLLLFTLAGSLPGQTPTGEERAVLTMSLGDSLIVVDSLVRTDGRLVSRVTNLQRARFLLEADLRDDASVERLHIVVWPWDRTVEDDPAVDAAFRPIGEVLMRETDDDWVVHREIEAGTFPYVGPSLAFVEQEILYARHLAGGEGSVSVPVWGPYGGDGRGRTWTDTVEFVGPDSIRIEGWNDVVSTYRIDADGRILSGRIEPAGYVVERAADSPE